MEKIKLVWPIEPVSSDKALDQEVGKFMRNLSEQMDLEIQPVSIMPSRYAQMGEYFESYDETPLREHLINDCEKYLRGFADLPLSPLVLIENFNTSQSAEVLHMEKYLEKEKPDFVVIASHGRKGWERVFLGSFTENLLLKAQCPVFVVGPRAKGNAPIQKAIMPLELSQSSKKFVEKFLGNHSLSFIKQLELFHKISMVDYEDISWAPTYYGVPAYDHGDIVKQAKTASTDFLSAFMDHPLSQKRLSYKISESIDAVPEVIVQQAADDKAGLIIMKSEAGVWAARLLGSVTKAVIRQAGVPVLVYPCHYKS